MLGSAERKEVRLISREIILEEFQRVWSQSTNVTDRHWTTYHDNTALRYALHANETFFVCFYSCTAIHNRAELLTMCRKSRDVASFKSQLSLSRMQRSIRSTSATEHPHSLLRTNVNVFGITWTWPSDIDCSQLNVHQPNKQTADSHLWSIQKSIPITQDKRYNLLLEISSTELTLHKEFEHTKGSGTVNCETSICKR